MFPQDLRRVLSGVVILKIVQDVFGRIEMGIIPIWRRAVSPIIKIETICIRKDSKNEDLKLVQ